MSLLSMVENSLYANYLRGIEETNNIGILGVRLSAAEKQSWEMKP